MIKANIIGVCLSILCLHAMASDLAPCSNQNGKYGFCDQSGNVVIDYKFSKAFDFINGHAPVMDGDKWGIINQEGRWMVKPVYDEVLNCDNLQDMILVRDGEKWALINAYGIQMTHAYEVALPLQEFEITNSTAHFTADSWFAVIKNGKWGAIDVNDSVRIGFVFDWVHVQKMATGRRFAVLKRDGKYGWSYADERSVSSFEYDKYLGTSGNIAFFKKGDASVLLDLVSGKEIDQTDAEFHALINTEDLMGLVNASGEIVIPYENRFVDIVSFPGLVIYGQPGAVGIADLSGKELLRKVFDQIRPIGSKYLRLKYTGGKEAIYKAEGTHLTNLTGFIFDRVEMENDQILVSVGDRKGYFKNEKIHWQD